MNCGPIKILDLFAGAGGLTWGFHQTSERFTIARAVEFDLEAAATYEANFGCGTVAAKPIEEWLLEDGVPEADVVLGGPPCQGFSALGKQDVQDRRNVLWRHYAEAVSRSGARYFVMENVPQFLQSPQYAELMRSCEDGILREYRLGPPVILNAADYGAPQARRRAVVVGTRRDHPDLGVPAATHQGNPMTVADALESVDPRVRDIALPSKTTEFRGHVFPGEFTLEDLHLTRNYTSLSLKRFAEIPAGGNRFDIPDELLSNCWRKHRSGSADVMGRLRWDRPSVTIRTEFFKPEKGRYVHPVEDRAITHLEAGLLQGFPPDSRWVGSKTAIARQIGNAVPVALSGAIARHMLAGFEDGGIVDSTRASRGSELHPASVS